MLKNPASECQTQCKALEDTWPGDRPDTKQGVEGRWLPVFARPSAQDVGDGRSCVGKVALLEEVRRAHCTGSHTSWCCNVKIKSQTLQTSV